MMTVTEIINEINEKVQKAKLPKGKKITVHSAMMKIKRAGMVPTMEGKKKLYKISDVAALYDLDFAFPNSKPKNEDIQRDALDMIEDAGTVKDAYEAWKKKIDERTAIAPSVKVEAEIERIMIDTFNRQLEVLEKVGTLLTSDEIKDTVGFVLSNLKKEISQIPGMVASIAPELSQGKISEIQKAVNTALQKASDGLHKL